MKRSYGYSAYRGRNRGRKVLVALIIILVLVLIAALAAFFLLQSHIYFGDDGKVHIELSGSAPEEEPPAPSVGTVVVVTPTPGAEASAPPRAALDLAEIPAGESVTAEALTARGANGALFVMKGTDGMLTYVSQLPQAVSMGTSGANTAWNEALGAMNGEEGLYTVARVSCFRDDRAPRMNNALALRSYAGNWLDEEGVRWLNPAVPETRAYLTGICRELAELGFDEIWLDAPCYPTNGELANIRVGTTYDPEGLTGPVETFYEEVRAALADYPHVKVSYTASSEVVTGAGDESGQTMELLKEYAYRLYLPAPDSSESVAAYSSALEGMAEPVYLTDSAYLSQAPAGGRILTSAEN